MKWKGRPQSTNVEYAKPHRVSPKKIQEDKALSSQQLTSSDSALQAEYRVRGSAGTKVASQKLKNLQDTHVPKPIDRASKAPDFTKGFQTNEGLVKNNLKGKRLVR